MGWGFLVYSVTILRWGRQLTLGVSNQNIHNSGLMDGDYIPVDTQQHLVENTSAELVESTYWVGNAEPLIWPDKFCRVVYAPQGEFCKNLLSSLSPKVGSHELFPLLLSSKFPQFGLTLKYNGYHRMPVSGVANKKLRILNKDTDSSKIEYLTHATEYLNTTLIWYFSDSIWDSLSER